ncbi:MAG TPA: FkbM family methyltransferase [Stellaceae bacterium]|nr:FkbM family methyltransferase [Stellaceae bacterium]
MRRRLDVVAWVGARLGTSPGFERVARWIVPPERLLGLPEVCLARDGLLFITRLGGPIGWHVAVCGSYEPELRQIMRVIVPAGGVAIDIGANTGWHTLLLAQLVGAEGRVLAVEANPSICNELKRNIQINQLGQVTVFAHALAEGEGELAFLDVPADDPGSASGHVVTAADKAVKSISVRGRPLDALARDAGIERLDFIKMDVEGFEWPVLQGGRQIISRFRPPMIFEFDAAYAPRGGGSVALLGEFFAGLGYRLYAVGRNWPTRIEPSRWPGCANILALPGD